MTASTARTGAFLLFSCAFLSLDGQQDPHTLYRMTVDMVALTFRVVDHHGKSIAGLTPEDFRISEDGIVQHIAAFSEGENLLRFKDRAPADAASIFVLFDTSNRMYSGFPYVCDAVSDFLRRLPASESVAVYTFSRNLIRVAPLTPDRDAARAGLRKISAGDDAALFNAILLTVRDAARVPGRKAIVVFSTGRDTASIVGPEDVGRVAENEGVAIYMVSTLDPASEPQLYGALVRLTTRTGGMLYCERDWRKHAAVFDSVREDIVSSYTAYYYPAPNPNLDFRKFRVELLKPGSGSYRVLAREGYEARKRM
jgi:VWFA-related protein